MYVSKHKQALSLLVAIGLVSGPAGTTLPVSAAPQQPPAAQSEPPVFELQTSAVVVDVVVRDKKGKLVRDLTAADFEIFEDGAKQAVESFRILDTRLGEHEPEAVAAPAASASPAAPAPSAPSPLPQVSAGAPSVISFVFDRMSPNARKQAEKAALTYTEKGHVPGDLVAVFSIDLALRTMQPFTNDLEAIKGGLHRAAAQGNTAFASEREGTRRRMEAVLRADDTLGGIAGGGAAVDSTTATQAALVAEQQVADRMLAGMERMFDSLERDQQGFATTNGLMAVVNGLKAIPGRKTVVFFSEGMAIPANVQAQFRSVIASANRSHVSIYTVDAGGLRLESGNKEARDEILLAARQRQAQEATGREFRGGAMTRTLERTEDLLRLNPEAGLGQLADETGGFAVRDTNDPSRGFARIQEDMRFHYLLTYSPTNDSYDGRFRSIAVKVKRAGTEVQTRKGYFAVRPEYALPVRTYEAPAIAWLERTPRPDAFPIHTAALSFPELERPGLVPVLVEIPGTAIAWRPERDSGFRAEFAVVVRIRDGKGREADRLSQQYNLTAPADKLEAARAGSILFYREANVPPGRYSADVVAFDSIAQTASVRSATLDVPKADANGLRMSSLVLVNRAEKLTEAEQKEGKNPLYFGEAILYPNMGTPIRKSVMPALGFYFSLYGKADAAAAGRAATIEVQQGSRTLAKTTAALPAPDATGRIQHAGALPLGGFKPGDYTLRVSVADGAAIHSRDAVFSVVE